MQKVKQKHKNAAWAKSKPENMLSIIVHNNPQAVSDFLADNYDNIPGEMSTQEIYDTCKEIANATENAGEWVRNLARQIIYNPAPVEAWTSMEN